MHNFNYNIPFLFVKKKKKKRMNRIAAKFVSRLLTQDLEDNHILLHQGHLDHANVVL